MDCKVGKQMRTYHGGDIVVVEGGIEHEMWGRQDTEFVCMLAGRPAPPEPHARCRGPGAPELLRSARGGLST